MLPRGRLTLRREQGEERVLSILGPEALQGVPRSIDICGLHTSQTSVPSTPEPLPLSPPTSGPLQCNHHGSTTSCISPPSLSTSAIPPQAPSTLAIPPPGPNTSAIPPQSHSTLSPFQHGHKSLRAVVSPGSQKSL